MPDAADYELEKEPPTGTTLPPRAPSRVPWLVAAALLLGAAGVFFYLHRAEQGVTVSEGAAATEEAVAQAEPLGVDVAPIELPPLDQSDSLVRELVRQLSSHPRVAAWLTTSGLIRNFVVVVDNIADGRTPAAHVRMLAPPGTFQVAAADDAVVVDPRTYRRYDDLAAAVASIDTAGAARLYSLLKPRIEEAYAELGRTGSFDSRLETALVRLLEAPAPEGEVSLVPRGALYAYGDPRLERMTAAQKQLMRFGPRHVRTIQRKLRDIGLALGIPAERLPRR